MTANEYSCLLAQITEAAVSRNVPEFERLSALHTAYLEEQGRFVERVMSGNPDE